MPEPLLRIVSLCIVLAGVETLHGIVRATWLVPRIGKAKALKVAIVSGSLLALAVCYLLVPDIGLTRTPDLFALGAVLALFMAGFDVALARWLLHRPWARVLDDFDPRTGNYLLYGVVLMSTYPYLVMRLH